jgi:hypothetical protein
MHYNKQKSVSLANAVAVSVPDKSIVKLSKGQIEGLRRGSEIALVLIAAAGIIAVSAVAPNLFVALNGVFPKKYKGRNLSHKEKIRKVEETFYYLKRSGLVRFKRSGKDWLLSLTDLGKTRLPKLNLSAVKVPKPRKWDNRWWLVAADIPTKKYRQGADLLRRKMKDMGFYSLQRTLWLYPFDPRREIEFVSQSFGVAHFVTVMEVARMDREDEDRLKRHFRGLNLI